MTHTSNGVPSATILLSKLESIRQTLAPHLVIFCTKMNPIPQIISVVSGTQYIFLFFFKTKNFRKIDKIKYIYIISILNIVIKCF